jgi:hypothetical protein
VEIAFYRGPARRYHALARRAGGVTVRIQGFAYARVGPQRETGYSR